MHRIPPKPELDWWKWVHNWNRSWIHARRGSQLTNRIPWRHTIGVRS